MKKIIKFIERKTLLYKTGVEYGDYTINHVMGCSHGCLYPCYAFMMAKRFGKIADYAEWLEPCLVSNALELLTKEIPRYKDKLSSVHLSFSTDPFMYGYTEISDMSMKIIKKLNDNGIKCTCLTKGLLPLELISFSKDNEYGITLISIDENFRLFMEPNTASYRERIQRLRILHENGCKTWISIEPYPTPNIIEQEFSEILNSVTFVDKIIFGKLNYNKKTREYKGYKKFYNSLSKQVIDFCEAHNMSYHIKDGTISELEGGTHNG